MLSSELRSLFWLFFSALASFNMAGPVGLSFHPTKLKHLRELLHNSVKLLEVSVTGQTWTTHFFLNQSLWSRILLMIDEVRTCQFQTTRFNETVQTTWIGSGSRKHQEVVKRWILGQSKVATNIQDTEKAYSLLIKLSSDSWHYFFLGNQII